VLLLSICTFFFLPLYRVVLCSSDRPWTCYVTEADLKLTILLPQSPKCWDYKCMPPHPTFSFLFLSFFILFFVFCFVLLCWDRVLLWSSNFPGIHYVPYAISDSQVLTLQAYATTPCMKLFLKCDMLEIKMCWYVTRYVYEIERILDMHAKLIY
jgi:hypothetical protein